MEAFGVAVSRPIPCISGCTGVEPKSDNSSLSGFFCSVPVGAKRCLRVSHKSWKLSGFSDQRHLDYYSAGRKIRCGAGGGTKEKVNEAKEMKKRLKMLKGLSRDLAMFSEMGFGLGSDPDNAMVDLVEAKRISDAAELLQGQLQQLQREEKELKQRRKEEKRRLKAAQMQDVVECQMSSSSCSSESSDSECGEVVDMNLLCCNPQKDRIPDASQPVVENETLALPSISTRQEVTANDLQVSIPEVKIVSETQDGNLSNGMGMEKCCNSGSVEQGWSSRISNNSGDSAVSTGSKIHFAGASAKKIEVCMGGKCKKSGAEVLLEEFQRVLGIESAVSGCKCLGKCRDGPNVRISNSFDDIQAGLVHYGVKPAANHLCVGVGLEDVDMIVDNFLGGSQKKFGLAAAS